MMLKHVQKKGKKNLFILPNVLSFISSLLLTRPFFYFFYHALIAKTNFSHIFEVNFELMHFYILNQSLSLLHKADNNVFRLKDPIFRHIY